MTDFICPCGGGQSCIVDRRRVGDYVHEDDLFRQADLPIREHCLKPMNRKQKSVMRRFIKDTSCVIIRKTIRKEKRKDN